MGFAESFFDGAMASARARSGTDLSEALSRGGDYADLYFEYLATSSIIIDESIVKSATQGVSMGVGVRVISGERTGYAYSDDLSPEKIRKPPGWPPASPTARPRWKNSTWMRPRTQSLSGADGAHRDGLRRARGTGQARRPGRARLRPARLSGAGDVCRQPAAGDGGHQRRRRSASTGSPWRA